MSLSRQIADRRRVFVSLFLSGWNMKKAECYLQGGRKKDALTVYTELITRHPDDEMTHLERARIYTG